MTSPGFHRQAWFLLLILPLAAFAGCGRTSGNPATAETSAVERGDITQHVSASGTLKAVMSVDVGSQVSGKITALEADFNSPVKKGQVLAEIDQTVYAATLRQALADVDSARAHLLLTQQNLARKQTLAPLKAISQLDLDQAVAELAQATAAVNIKTAAVETARANISYCKITSPVDGLVISRHVDVGQTLIAAMSTPVLFTIARDITRMTINASISEADIGGVKVGQAVEFSVDAFPDEVFQGRVTQVRMAPTTTQNVVTYETVIAVENPEQKLFPGMTADISIQIAERKNVLKVANAALRFSPPEGSKFDGKPPERIERNQRLAFAPGTGKDPLKPVVIRTGISDGLFTEILGGAEEGDKLVTSIPSDSANRGFGGPTGRPPGT